jgi:CRISPR-associated protein Cmr6
MRYPLPRDTAAILATHANHNHNLGLALDRHLPINEERDDEGQPWKNPNDQWKLTDRTKRRGYAPLSLRMSVPTLLSKVNARRAAMFASMPGITVVSAEPDYRLVLGFGVEHVLETNLCLHRIYGFPIVPGSAVKGITRARAFWEIAEGLGVPAVTAEEATRRKAGKEKTPLQLLDQLLTESDQKKQQEMLETLRSDLLCSSVAMLQSLALSKWLAMADEFHHIFGTTEHQGQVIFFDAYPTRMPKLEVDILNPHYSKYYQGGEPPTPPADYLDPVPTYFLTVAKGSPFQFAVASKRATLVNKAKTWLAEALADLGIGSKTSAGYGFMEVKP